MKNFIIFYCFEILLCNEEEVYIDHYPTNGKSDIFNVVGHIHGTWKVQRNMVNVGVDALITYLI